MFMGPRNWCQGINSASLCSPGGPVRKPYSSSVPSPHRLFKNSSSDDHLSTFLGGDGGWLYHTSTSILFLTIFDPYGTGTVFTWRNVLISSLFSILVGHFCPPGSRSALFLMQIQIPPTKITKIKEDPQDPDRPDWIRIHSTAVINWDKAKETHYSWFVSTGRF